MDACECSICGMETACDRTVEMLGLKFYVCKACEDKETTKDV